MDLYYFSNKECYPEQFLSTIKLIFVLSKYISRILKSNFHQCFFGPLMLSIKYHNFSTFLLNA